MSTKLPEAFLFLLEKFPGFTAFESNVTVTESGATVATYFHDPHVEVDTDELETEMIYAYGHKVLGCDDAYSAIDLVDIELHDIVPVEEYDYVYRAFATITKK